MAAAGAFGVEGMNGAALEGLDGVLDVAYLVEGVSVDHHLDVMVDGNRLGAVDRRRRRAPVLVQLEGAGAGFDLLFQRRRPGRVAFAGEAEVHRKRVRGLDHAADVPRTGRAGGGVGAGSRAGAAAQHGGDAGHQRFFDLLRADEVEGGVEAAAGGEFSFAVDNFLLRTGDDGGPRLDGGL